jgi:hypothetical protein
MTNPIGTSKDSQCAFWSIQPCIHLGVENEVASEVILESFSTIIPSNTSGAVILPSANYIESSCLDRTEQGNRSTTGTRTLIPLKKQFWV